MAEIRGVVSSALSDRTLLRHVEYVRLLEAEEARLNQAPSEFKVLGNVPNPFNPATTIRFPVPSPSRGPWPCRHQELTAVGAGRPPSGRARSLSRVACDLHVGPVAQLVRASA